MTILYFDTCALAKRYYREPGHRRVKQLVGNKANHIAFSDIGIIEMSSVLHKKVRQQELTDENAKLRLSRFFVDIEDRYNILPSTNNYLNNALGYVRKHDLSTLDSIHFATAVKADRNTSNFIFVSADKELINAAKAENMNFVNPDP